MGFDYEEITSENRVSVDIDMIDQCDDEATLNEWFRSMDDLYDEIRFFIEERNFAGVADPDWLESASGKCAYLKKGKKRVEGRMLRLGFNPPYHPADPRARHIRNLETKLKKVKAIMRDHGLTLVELDEAA